MNKAKILDLMWKYEQKSRKADYNYQMTGNSRYLTTFRQSEELIEALKVALDGADAAKAITTIRMWKSELINSDCMTESTRRSTESRIINEIKEYGGKNNE